MRKPKQTAVYTEESRLFYVAVLSCIIVLGAYMYFLSTSIVHVVMRKEVDTQISDLGSKISKLESVYIERQHAVSNDIAVRQGYVEAENKIFIDKSGDTLVLLRN
jgi:hypothetical protein